MSDTTITTPPAAPTAEPTDNPVIRQMRAEIDAAKKREETAKTQLDAATKAAEEATKKLTEIERAKLEEAERLRLEVADRDRALTDAAPIRDEHGRFATALQTIYDAELAAVPDALRENVRALSNAGDLPARLDSLRRAKDLLVSAAGAAPPPPAIAGTHGQPGASAVPPIGTPPVPPVAPPKPANPKDFSWGNAFDRRGLQTTEEANRALTAKAKADADARKKAAEEAALS